MKNSFKQLSVGLASAVGAVTLGLWVLPAQAQSTFDVTVLAASCANCHGTDGRSPGGMPSLAGRPEAVLNAQLMAYKSDTPPAGTTVMNRLAKGYSDDELAALAKHFSQIKPQATDKK